jgi:hypothetical protein
MSYLLILLFRLSFLVVIIIDTLIGTTEEDLQSTTSTATYLKVAHEAVKN